MRKLYILFFTIILSTSCEGPVGPPGLPGPIGPPGEDGVGGLLGQVFEVEADLNIGTNFEYYVEIPSEIEVFESDIVMVYRLMAGFEGTDIWEPLPQTIFRNSGILLYTFDYTLFDVRLFLDGTADFGRLDPIDTDNLIFRIAVIPADYAKELDLKKMDNVLKGLNIEEVKRVN
ncbi:MAG: collagen-like protein [Flavobacteriaceae bacterium]|nr:MAG: collagen-like protein [Flavobacteriaceae bacterium]